MCSACTLIYAINRHLENSSSSAFASLLAYGKSGFKEGKFKEIKIRYGNLFRGQPSPAPVLY